MGMANPRTADLTQGPVGKRLALLTLPMVAGMLSIVAFNMADTAFVGQLGTRQLAAISFTFPVVMILGAVALGLGHGTSAVISRAVGSADIDRVRRLTTDAMMLALLMVGVVATVGVSTIDPVFRLLGATDDLLPMIRQYMSIWYIGSVFVVVPMVGNNAIRASGDTFWPAVVMGIGAGVNIVLDPLLIFQQLDLSVVGIDAVIPAAGWGLSGAAIATVIARAVTLTASLAILHYRKRMLVFLRPRLREVWHSWGKILFIGLPSAGTTLMYPLTIAIITRIVARYGKAAVASIGAAGRVEAFAMLVVWATGSTLLAFLGQNIGAGRVDRARRAHRLAWSFALVWGLVCAGVFAIFGRAIGRVFTQDPRVIDHLQMYLWIVPACYGMRGVCILGTTAFNALHKPLSSSLLMGVRLLGLYVPLALLGSWTLGLYGVFAGICAANVIAGIGVLIWFRRVWPREEQLHAAPSSPGRHADERETPQPVAAGESAVEAEIETADT